MSYVKTSVGYRRRSKRSRVRKRRVFATLAIVTLATLTAWLWNDGRNAPSGPGVAAATTARVVSLPAAPYAPRWTNARRYALGTALRDAFAPALTGAKSWSLAVVSLDGSVLFGDNADGAVAPASVQKLIVASSALAALGPAYRFHTLFAAQQSIAGGVLDGDLWLVGSGDPSLQSSDLRNGIAVLSRGGLRRINGGVLVDASALGGPPLNSRWGDNDGQEYAPPTSAISVDGDNFQDRPMQDVPRWVEGQMQAMLAERSIESAAAPALGAAPLASVVLWDHKSAPLRELAGHMLYESDNHYAEQLLRTVGGEVSGEADDAGGVAAEQRFLDREGIPVPGLKLFDGSGLSADNRVAAITVARLLVAQEPSLYRLLPLGGREGTLADYDFTTALGRVRAKSGHLSDVSALAGYATTMHRGRVAFAFLIDGSPGDPDASIVRAIDRLVLY